MKRILSFIGILAVVGVFSGNAFGANLGDVSGSWEAKGHWQTAGNFGIVCEERDKDKRFKVKVYAREGHLYKEFTDFRYWPNSCNVTTAQLQEYWGNLGTIVEDHSFLADRGEKTTWRRWFIQ